MAWSWLTAASTSQGLNNPPTSASQVGRATGAYHHHACLIFVFLVEMGFHHVAQAGLKLLGLSDLSTPASQNAEITDMSHHDQVSVSYEW